jgi:hypothetical protein
LNNTALQLKRRLKDIGLSDSAINAAWPTWWSESADASTSAKAELRFSLARKLGLDPHSLLEDDQQPRFVWRDEARFKRLSSESVLEQSAITSFGTALGRYLVAAIKPLIATVELKPVDLRNAVLQNHAFVDLSDLLAVSWSFGIPVIHLRVFPCDRKRMSAMAVRTGDRTAIMLARDSVYPPEVLFNLAHELGHISLGHLSQQPIIVDLDDTDPSVSENDPEEMAADKFALELLTGRSEFKVLPKSAYNAKELARVSREISEQVHIEPGILARCFGHSTNDWATANAAVKRIYGKGQNIWEEINKLAINQLELDLIPDDATAYVKVVLGETGAL